MVSPIIRTTQEACVIFCDESSHTGHRYCVLGAMYFYMKEGQGARSAIRSFEDTINDERKKERVLAEIKWSKVPKKEGKYFGFYKKFVTRFFNNKLYFSCIIIDTKATPLSHRTSMHDHEIGFYKFYYQLLANNIIRRFPKDVEFRVVIDYKQDRWPDSLETLERVLNIKVMGRIPSRARERMVRVQAIRSHELNLLQLMDLLTGAVAAKWNKRTTSRTKLALIDYIEKKSGNRLDIPTSMTRKTFNIWLFKPRQK